MFLSIRQNGASVTPSQRRWKQRTDMSKKVKARLRDPASWLPLAAEASSRNLAWEFFDMSVLVSNLSYLQREHKFVRVRTYK